MTAAAAQATPATGGAAAATARLPARPALPRELRRRLRSARELARAVRDERREPLVTGVGALDRALGGGLPRGRLVELVGRRSSGRFSTVLATLATVTAGGEAAALVDLGDALEPAAAAAFGVVLERLLWVRPRDVQQALAAAEAVLQGGLPLVVVDLGVPPVAGGRGNEAAWTRLARAARAQGAALLVASPYRASGTAAAAVVEAADGRAVWLGGGCAPRLLAGLGAHLTAAESRGAGGEGGALRLAAYAADAVAPPPAGAAPDPTAEPQPQPVLAAAG